MARQQTAANELVHNRLVQVGCMDVSGLLADRAFPDDGRIAGHETDAQAGRNDLAETAEEHHPSICIETLDGRKRRACIAKITVRIILRHHDMVLIGKLRNTPAAVCRKRLPGRVLECRNRVEHLGMVLPDFRFEIIRKQPVSIAFHRHQVGLIKLHALEIAQEGRIFHQNRVTGINHGLAEQVHRLGGTGNRQDSRDFALQHIRDVCTQALQERCIPFRGSVLQDGLSVLREDIDGQLGNQLVGKGVQGRIAAGKRDHTGLRNDLENLSDGASADIVKAVGEMNC